MSELKFGKKIVSVSYFEGKETKLQISYSVPIQIKDKSQALSEIIKSLDLIAEKKTKHVTLIIKADDDYKLKLITREYVTSEEIK